MNKFIFSLILPLLYIGCDSDNDTNSPLAGQTFVITSYRLETLMDFNGDGQFSNDLLIETPLFSPFWLDVFNECLSIESLRFEEEGIACPFGNGLFLKVVEDENGNLVQESLCAVFICDGYTEYSINNDNIVFSFDSGFTVEGIFLNDNMIFTFSEEEIPPFEFLQSDGTVHTYTGAVTITYTLE